VTVSDEAEGQAEGVNAYRITLDPSQTSAGATKIVVAEDEGGWAGAVIVGAEVTGGATIVVAPIGLESTAEVDVLLSATAAGDLSAHRDEVGRLRLFVDETMAAGLETAADAKAALEGTSRAVAAGVASFRGTLERELGTLSNAVVAGAHAAAQADVALDGALHAAASGAEVDAAFAAHLSAYAQAYLQAGCSRSELAAAMHAAAETMARYATELPDALRARVEARAEALRARLSRDAVEAFLAALKPPAGTLDATVSAGAELETAIGAAASLGVGASAHIASAWSAYGDKVEQALASAAEKTKGALEKVKNDVAAARAKLERELASCQPSLAPAAGAAIVASAYAAFYASGAASVGVGELVIAGTSELEAQAVVGILFELAAH
jgi:hypothetical protein